MVAWMLGVFAAPMVLAGFGVYLCRRPRRHRRLTCEQIAGQAPGTAAMASPAPGSADFVHRRQLEKSVAWSGRERLQCLWYRLRLELADINYAQRRLVELQIPWIADPQWHTKTNPPPHAGPTGAPSLDSDDYPSH